MVDVKEHTQRIVTARKQAFDTFIEMPTTKFMMSLIPPSENPDALRVLMKSVFDSGFNYGGTFATIDLLTSVTKDLS